MLRAVLVRSGHLDHPGRVGFLRRLGAPVAVAALLTAGAGCATLDNVERTAPQAIPVEKYLQDTTGSPVEGASLAYRLQVGDVVDVKFPYAAELNETLLVRPDGRASMQHIGEIGVAGMTPEDLSTAITEGHRKVLRRPQATAIVRKYAARRVFVGGEVNTPGAQVLETPLTVLQAVMQAGGFRSSAERSHVVVLRQGDDGKPVFLKLDLRAHIGQAAEQDLVLKPFDVVFVPQSKIASVAQFMDEYIGKIVPLYRNLGFAFTYNIRPTVRLVQ